MRAIGLALLGLVAATPVLAANVLESVTQVSYRHAGEDYVFNDNHVPLLADNACYNWYIRVDTPNAELAVVERFTLPEPVEWGEGASEAAEDSVIEGDGKVIVTPLPVTTDEEGWFSNGWCVVGGDPEGSHLIEVSLDGKLLASFPFEMLPVSAYNFPSPAMSESAGRSANLTW